MKIITFVPNIEDSVFRIGDIFGPVLARALSLSYNSLIFLCNNSIPSISNCASARFSAFSVCQKTTGLFPLVCWCMGKI